jgi:preprotein translocase subunit SecG
MQVVLIVIHLMIVLAMIGLVLLQRSEGGGLGMGSSGGFLTTRGTSNILSRSTAALAIAFFITSLLLSWLAGFDRKPASILQSGGTPAPTAPAPGQPPLGQGGRGVLDTLRGGGGDAPAAPAGPQVPSSQ